MKQLSSVLNGVLLVAVIALFVLHFSSTNTSTPVTLSGNGEVVGVDSFQVAFVNTDSLLINYKYAKELTEKMIAKEETSRAGFNEKAKIFQEDAVEFQRKLQNNGFLSRERAEQEQQRLSKAERALTDLNQRLQNELMKEQDATNRMLRDTIANFMKEFGKGKHYKLILSNMGGDNILYSVSSIDITEAVIEGINKRYEEQQD